MHAGIMDDFGLVLPFDSEAVSLQFILSLHTYGYGTAEEFDWFMMRQEV